MDGRISHKKVSHTRHTISQAQVESYVDNELFALPLLYQDRETVSFNVHAEQSDGAFIKTAEACDCASFPPSSTNVQIKKRSYIRLRRAGPGMTSFEVFVQTDPKLLLPNFLLANAYKKGLEYWLEVIPSTVGLNQQSQSKLSEFLRDGPYPATLAKDASQYQGSVRIRYHNSGTQRTTASAGLPWGNGDIQLKSNTEKRNS